MRVYSNFFLIVKENERSIFPQVHWSQNFLKLIFKFFFWRDFNKWYHTSIDVEFYEDKDNSWTRRREVGSYLRSSIAKLKQKDKYS